MARGARPGNRNAYKPAVHTARLRALFARVMIDVAKNESLVRSLSLPAPAGCDFISPDIRGQGAGRPPKTSPREN